MMEDKLYNKMYLAEKTLKSYSILCYNWDSYGATTITESVIQNGLDYLNYIVWYAYYNGCYELNIDCEPIADGRVSLEFSYFNKILSITISDNFDLEVYREELDSIIEDDYMISHVNDLDDRLNWLLYK